MRAALAFVAGMSGCVTFDWAVHNPVHCSTVDEQTCDGSDWDSVCDRCEDAYDLGRDYPYYPNTLAGGESVRPIDPNAVTWLRVPTEDGLGELDAVFVPAHGEVAALAETTVVFNHGNYAGLEHYMPRIRYLHELGYAVLAWDYRGYGKSEPPAAPTDVEFLADARTLRDLADTVAPDPSRLVIYGNSIGAVPAVEMALHAPGCALLLEVPFPGFTEVGRAATGLVIPEGFLSRGELDNTRKIADYAGPLFVMAGGADALFPPPTLERLYENAPTAAKDRWILDGVGHGVGQGGGVPEAGLRAYGEAMRAFLDAHAPGCLGP